MEIILSKQCEALTGSLGEGFGYAIQRRTDHNGRTRFWGVRNSTGAVPSDGHLRFIFACAELAQAKLHITDIQVSGYELKAALNKAAYIASALCVDVDYEYSADEVLQFKNERGL